MTFRQLKKYMHENLSFFYPSEEIQFFYFILLDFYGKISKTEILFSQEKYIDNTLKINILEAIEELKTQKPIQYILGETEFFSNRFFVNENVLIPRQETEELVAWILSEVPKNEKIRILDIGTGSGCIAISLAKKLPMASVEAIDISEKAIEIAKKNASQNKVDIRFYHQNILETHSLSSSYDIIVSNPPYVRELEKQEIGNNVLNFEPHLALFVSDENPLIFYEKIAKLAKISLTKKGKLFFEINQYLGKEMIQLIENQGFTNIELRNDLNNNPRMLKAENSIFE